MRRLIPALFALSACSPGVDVQVLRPPEILLPDDVQKLLIVDRAAPKNTGEHVLSFIEGVLTAEGLFADRDGRNAAVAEMAEVLRGSPRYDVLGVLGDGEVSTSIWDDNAAPLEIKKLCDEYGCDAIVALDAFDSDSDILDLSETVLSGPNAGDVLSYVARRDTRLLTSWDVYDGLDGLTLDAYRDVEVGNIFDADGDNWNQAMAGLPDGRSVVKGLALDASLDYGGRIAPLWETVRRPIYGKGDDTLESAADHVRQDDLDGAVAIWETKFDAADAELAGKCLYNAAVVTEQLGDLDGALVLARDAEKKLPNGRISRYSGELATLAASWRPGE